MFTRKKEEPTSTPAAQTITPPRKPGDEPHAPGVGFKSTADEAKVMGSRPSSSEPGARAAALEPMSRLGRASRTSAGNSSVLNSHLFFQGDLRYAGTVTLDCELHGSVTTDDMLIVGSSARIEGEVHAGVVEVSGKVHGNIFAKTRVKIFTGGEVCGDIETPTVSMDEGVAFEGRCRRPPVTSPVSPSHDVQKVLAGAESVLGHAPASTSPAPTSTPEPRPSATTPVREAVLTT
jgi:cytoskeletal protein CcmA (bactofilin family)